MDVSTKNEGYVTTKVLTGGYLGRNKGVVIDTYSQHPIEIPNLSKKDMKAIKIGLNEGVEHIAFSFARSGSKVDEVKKATHNRMKIISKIECLEALKNLDDIIKKSDFLLLDRGDLSKEIPIRKIPFVQKLIISNAKKYNKGVFIATNLLESMVEKRKPTRAEVHDVITSILDGANGLILSAETAIGRHPIECINMLHDLVNHVECSIDIKKVKKDNFKYKTQLENSDYLLDTGISSLVTPHGGKLVNRILEKTPKTDYLSSLPKIKVDASKQMEVEQIAIGTFSPLEGFMNEDDLNSVLEEMRLSNGMIWPLPIVLDVTVAEADKLTIGDKVALTDSKGEIFAILQLDSKYTFDKEEISIKIYGTSSNKHPGVQMINSMNPILLSGKISLINRMKSPTRAYELTPKQVRTLFEENGWIKIAGFHTRNIPHRGHEFIHFKVLENEYLDGIFIHPVVGKKKKGDFDPLYILKSYEKLIKNFYPPNKVVLSAFSTFSRYAGPREAVFTALCRKNFGCSHFIVGRDHTGVGNFYHPQASQKIFDDFPDIGIRIIKVDEIVYSKKMEKYFSEKGYPNSEIKNKVALSGTLVRDNLKEGVEPPDWLIRPEISKFLLEEMRNNKQIFVSSS